MVWSVGLAWLGLMSCGCYNTEEVKAFLQVPRSPVSGVEYRIAPPDVLTVTSLQVQEVNQVTQQVRPDGKINVPLLGEVFVAGKTPAEVEEALADMAKEYYSEVSLTVEVLHFNSRRYYVFGQVFSPGPLPWTGHDTVLDALSKSQPNELSWPERVLIVRGDKPSEGGFPSDPPDESFLFKVGGVRPEQDDRPRHVLTVNLLAMLESGDLSSNVLLMPNDIVYVQPNPFARVGLLIQNILFPLVGARDLVNESRWWIDGLPRERTTTTRNR